MAIQPAQPQTIGGVLDTTFQLYKASVAKVWVLCLLGAIGSALPSIYMVVKGAGNPGDPMAMLGAMSSPGYWLTYLLGITISLWTMGALYLKVNSIGVDAEIGLGEALQSALGRILILVAVTLLFTIALTIGLILLIIPGLILLVSLMLSFNLAMVENKGPIDSLTGSHNLVWGNWWRSFVIVSVGFIVVFVIYFAVALVIGVVMPLIGLGSDDPLAMVMVTTVAVTLLVSLIVTPFYIALLVALYWDLKLRKEGGDLAARVNALGAA